MKNGDTWTIERRHHNGDLTVRHTRHAGRVRLPEQYVDQAVELGYATTTARAQGMTVDTAHVLVDESTSRESLYVAATRGREGAQLYVNTNDLIGLDAARPPAPETTARQVLEESLRRETGERSATEVQREGLAQAESLARTRARYHQSDAAARHTSTIRRSLNPNLAATVLQDPAYSALARTLVTAEAKGQNPTDLLTRAAARRELETADSIAQVLQYRVELMITGLADDDSLEGTAVRALPRAPVQQSQPRIRQR